MARPAALPQACVHRDTIYTIRTNLGKEPKYDQLGLIRASYEVFKGEGELVLYCEHIQTVRYRSGQRPDA